jgi:hypothetical protein
MQHNESNPNTLNLVSLFPTNGVKNMTPKRTKTVDLIQSNSVSGLSEKDNAMPNNIQNIPNYSLNPAPFSIFEK